MYDKLLGIVLSGEAIKRGIRDRRIRIEPFDEKQVEAAHINLHLGDSEKMQDDSLVMEPNDFVLARTLERVTLPQNICGSLEGRSKLAQLGVSIEQSSTFVEPGSDSDMVLEMKNVSNSTVHLKRGQKIAKLILMRITNDF